MKDELFMHKRTRHYFILNQNKRKRHFLKEEALFMVEEAGEMKEALFKRRRHYLSEGGII